MDTKHKPEYFKSFYTRRVLRILPAYLLMNAVLYFTHFSTWVNVVRLVTVPGQYEWSAAGQRRLWVPVLVAVGRRAGIFSGHGLCGS